MPAAGMSAMHPVAEDSALPETSGGTTYSLRWQESSVRLIALLMTLILIVGLAYLIRAQVTSSTVNSVEWVAHTHEVEARVFELAASLNEMEASAFASQFDPLSEEAARRYGEARARYTPILDKLRTLTIDNPAQQERLGMLRAQVEGRVKLFDEAVMNRSEGRAAGSGLMDAVTRFPADSVLDAIIGEEQKLKDQREAAARRRASFGNWIIGAASIVQLLLLAGIIWGSENQLRRRLNAEATARTAVERSRMIVATVREPIAVVNQDLALIECNQAFTDYYGLKPGGALAESRAWNDAMLLQRLRDVALTRRELWDYELSQTLDTGARHVVVSARTMALPDSKDLAILMTVSDITARKQSEAQILELNRQLEGKIEQITESNRELEAFSYSVSHDLRAPLRHIAGFAEKLRTHLGESADERTQHYAGIVVDSSKRMSSLIEDLLTYSRLGRHAMRLQGVDMQALVNEVRIALTSGAEDDRRITWRIAPLPVVIADENMIRLVWQNLVDNAMKYSRKRENAIIEIGTGEATPLEYTFFVRDNGVGFDPAYGDKLFGVFQRLHKASEFAGTGIGLASVRRIISRHGGRTWAESEPDHGAAFYFSLPRTQNQF